MPQLTTPASRGWLSRLMAAFCTRNEPLSCSGPDQWEPAAIRPIEPAVAAVADSLPMVDLCSLDGYHSGGGSRARSSSTRTCSASCARKHMAGASALLPQPSCSSITPGRRTWPHGDNLELRPRGQRLCHSTSASCAGLARAAWSIADAHMATSRSPFSPWVRTAEAAPLHLGDWHH